MKRRFHVKLTKRASRGKGDQRLLVLGAALSSALAASKAAEAVPIYADPDDVHIKPDDGVVNLNLSNILNPTFNGVDATIQYNREPNTNNLNLQFNSLNNMATGTPNPLNLNAEIGPRNNFLENFNLASSNPLGGGTGGWLGTTNGFLGMQVDIPGGSPHFGWIRLSVDDNLGVVVHDFAIESIADTPIAAGAGAAIPEPGSLGLLALGAAGLVAWRRRRSES